MRAVVLSEIFYGNSPPPRLLCIRKDNFKMDLNEIIRCVLDF
jgi:hypothetical protein